MISAILWIVYLFLLAVLLPHTAWAFQKFEPVGAGYLIEGISITSWAAAFAFESAIAALTHKLSKHIEQTPKRIGRLAKFSFRYLNAYSVGLVISLGISSLANLAHAVQFGGDMKIFADWGIPFGVYAFSFGAILPMISLTFARVLSNVVESDSSEDPAVIELREQLANLRKQLRDSEQGRTQAEARFAALGDVFIKLTSPDKRERIIAIYRRWPGLTGAAIALLADSSAPYVSEVLKEHENVV